MPRASRTASALSALRGTERLLLASALAGAAFALACNHGDSSTGPTAAVDLGGVPACGASTLLTVSPVALSSINWMIPLGNLNPTAHTFPTDHIYFVLSQSSALVAPGAVRVTEVMRQQSSQGSTVNYDYGIEFYPCRDVRMAFSHVSALSTDFAARVGSFDSAACGAPYSTGGWNFVQCRKRVSIDLTAGAALGSKSNEVTLDWFASDMSAPAQTLTRAPNGSSDATHVVCPVNYMTASAAAPLLALFGGQNARRTVAPVCGSIQSDIVGTAMGRWYNGTSDMQDPHLALAPSNVDPSVQAFSVGTSIPTAAGRVWTFTPTSTGRLNRDFQQVTPDGQVYCYNTVSGNAGSFLLRLESSTSLRVEYRNGVCSGDVNTWAFSAAAVMFSR